MPYKRQTDKKLALKLEIQTYLILPNDDEFFIPSISSILLAVLIQVSPYFSSALSLMETAILYQVFMPPEFY